jgi:hypothetical protein
MQPKGSDAGHVIMPLAGTVENIDLPARLLRLGTEGRLVMQNPERPSRAIYDHVRLVSCSDMLA